MSNFIEIPIVVKNNPDEDIDYDSLGIDELETPKDTITALVNLDGIGRINSVEGEELYKTCLFPFDETQAVFRTPLEYEEIKSLIIDNALYQPTTSTF